MVSKRGARCEPSCASRDSFWLRAQRGEKARRLQLRQMPRLSSNRGETFCVRVSLAPKRRAPAPDNAWMRTCSAASAAHPSPCVVGGGHQCARARQPRPPIPARQRPQCDPPRRSQHTFPDLDDLTDGYALCMRFSQILVSQSADGWSFSLDTGFHAAFTLVGWVRDCHQQLIV